MSVKVPMDKLPFFSIIVPTYNRPGPLAECLAGMARLDYPKELFEVIVVDDGSKVSPQDVVDSFKGSIDIRLIRQSNNGPASARNRGARNAQGTHLVFTDDDCSPAPYWLKAFAAQFSVNPDAVIGGKVMNALGENSYAAASQVLTDYLYDYFNSKLNAASFFTTNNIAVSKEGFFSVGGYDESFSRTAGEDREFCNRWTHLGRAMIYAPEAIVHHSHRMNIFGFWRQHFHYGWGAFRIHHKRALLRRDKIRLEPMAFYFRLLATPFTRFKGLKALGIGFLIGISQFAYALGFFLTTIQFKLTGTIPGLKKIQPEYLKNFECENSVDPR